MIVLYAEKEDMGYTYAAALGGIDYNGKKVTTSNLAEYYDRVKRDLGRKDGYVKTNYNGKEIIVTWGWGHFGKLCDIQDYHPEYKYWRDIPLPFFPEKFQVKRIKEKDERFKTRNDKQMSIITKLFNSPKCEYIVNGTDWEREGELIFAYIYDLTGSNKPYKRLRSNSKTERQIQKDFSRLVSEDENYPKVLAARGRSIADWIVGINMTVASTEYLSGDGKVFNVGRVLTPTLNLIVSRELEIINYVETVNYGLEGTFKLPSGETYKGKCDTLYPTIEEANSILRDLEDKGVIIENKIEVKRENPPLLHNTQSLQIEANEIYKISANDTIAICQSLYEKGFITYPRVDSQYLTEDKKTEMEAIMKGIATLPEYKGKFIPKNLPNRYFNDKKVDGHDAIIATEELPKNLSGKEKNMYDLIVRRMIMAVSDPAEIEKRTVVTEVKGSDEPTLFKTYGTRYLKEGFLIHKPGDRKLEDVLLPDGIKENEKVIAIELTSYEQVSKPPQRFTEASLLKAMENCGRKVEDEKAKEYLKKSKGIGRPATRGPLIERLLAYGFVERTGKEGGKLKPTDLGMSVIERLTVEEIKSPILTADWEERLDIIEQDTTKDAALKDFLGFIKDIKSTTTKWCKEIEAHKVPRKSRNSLGITCPLCGGDVIKGKDGYFCSNYKEKECKLNVKFEVSGKKITEKMLEDLCKNGETKMIKNFTSKKGTKFNARLAFKDALRCKDCGAIQADNESCYKCKGELTRDPSGRKLTGFKDISFE